jgi:hypothetical protein
MSGIEKKIIRAAVAEAVRIAKFSRRMRSGDAVEINTSRTI